MFSTTEDFYRQMQDSLLQKLYAPEEFRKNGHALIDQLADHMQENLKNDKDKAIVYQEPQDEYEFWKQYKTSTSFEAFNKEVIARCVHLHNPKYLGHQISPPAPITALSSLLNAVLNNGMGIYEMGMAPTAMERVVCKEMCDIIGFTKEADGFLTSGGTLANLTALLSARSKIVHTNVWENGNTSKLAVMVSEEAHYCIDRAARIMGLGSEGIIKVAVNKGFEIRAEQLELQFKKAQESGLEVFALIGSAPSTATGIYDNLERLALFARQKKIWFHVDGAHGGAAVFSKKYKHLVKGIEQADSIAIDGHKMMMMPSITTALLFKNGKNAHQTFQQKADYLLEESLEEDWYNLAKRTFECTKYMMSLHWYILFRFYGKIVFDSFVTTLYDLGHEMGEILAQDTNFELAVKPVSNIVCFRITNPKLSEKNLNLLNAAIRESLLKDGTYYIVQTKLNGIIYLRCTIMNPFTSKKIIKDLLQQIKLKARELSV